MQEHLKKIREDSFAKLAGLRSEEEIYAFKTHVIGRKGILTDAIKQLKNAPADKKPYLGKIINELKNDLESAIDTALKTAKEQKKKEAISSQTPDITLPGSFFETGTKHPLTIITDRIIDIFLRLGFDVVEGPEVELDFFNFEALNIPKDHPARDMHDTFYISDQLLLRTHTSPVQIRAMQEKTPPLRIICPGKVYRCDSDISHTPMFHQIEGLMVGSDISMGDLKGILTILIHELFSRETRIRFRPSFFPFTEPSAEIDIQCVICSGSGCRVCSGSGWLEILGSGMVHPQVLKNVGYDPDSVNGFAFGLGVERIAMLTFGINDIRLFFENNLRFLSQFKNVCY